MDSSQALAAQFAALLKRVGYQQRQKDVEGASLEWVFEHARARPLLAWILKQVRADNIVTTEELRAYDALPTKVRGAQLAAALATLRGAGQSAGHAAVSVDHLRARRRHLEASLARMRRRRDMLEVQASANAARATALRLQVAQSHGAKDTAWQGAATAVAGVRRALSASEATCADLVTALDQGEAGGRTTLGQVALGPVCATEDACLTQMELFTEAQFSCNARISHDSRHALLGLTEPHRLVVQGCGAEEHAAHTRELERLREALPASIVEWAHARAAHASAAAARDVLTGAASAPVPGRAHTQVQALEEQVRTLARRVVRLQCAFVVGGDYNLKMARMALRHRKQTRVLHHVLATHARWRILAAAMDADRAMGRHAGRLVGALTDACTTRAESTRAQARALEAATARAVGCRPDRSVDTIDARDTWALAVHAATAASRAAGTNPGWSDFVPVEAMVAGAEAVAAAHDDAWEAVRAREGTAQDALAAVAQAVSRADATVYGVASTGGIPVLQASLRCADEVAATADAAERLGAAMGVVVKQRQSAEEQRLLARHAHAPPRPNPQM